MVEGKGNLALYLGGRLKVYATGKERPRQMGRMMVEKDRPQPLMR